MNMAGEPTDKREKVSSAESLYTGSSIVRKPMLDRSDAFRKPFRKDQAMEDARKRAQLGNVDRLNSSRDASNQQERGI